MVKTNNIVIQVTNIDFGWAAAEEYKLSIIGSKTQTDWNSRELTTNWKLEKSSLESKSSQAIKVFRIEIYY
jgi:hypothetical protein